MPRVHIVFKIPEENEEYKTTMRAGEYYSALWDFSQYLRGQLKYNNQLTEKEVETFEKIKTEFYSIVGDLLDD